VRRITPDIGDFSESVIASLNLQDEPLGMISFFLLERLVNAAAQHGRILLTGDGGDEVFLGYGQPRDWRIEKAEPATSQRPEVTCGPALPDWFSAWGRDMATNSLVGHGFAKVDRASAEQGVEIRCPLLDWDLVSYARSLPYDLLFPVDRSKSLLKVMLKDWPQWFVERKKVGFVYNIRWFWRVTGHQGLREAIDPEAIVTFERHLPLALRQPPGQWKNQTIFSHFQHVWRLLSWSCFLSRNKASAKKVEWPVKLVRSPYGLPINA
jgi:asparagine synthetase B (glutamine-hydrolysing)